MKPKKQPAQIKPAPHRPFPDPLEVASAQETTGMLPTPEGRVSHSKLPETIPLPNGRLQTIYQSQNPPS